MNETKQEVAEEYAEDLERHLYVSSVMHDIAQPMFKPPLHFRERRGLPPSIGYRDQMESIARQIVKEELEIYQNRMNAAEDLP